MTSSSGARARTARGPALLPQRVLIARQVVHRPPRALATPAAKRSGAGQREHALAQRAVEQPDQDQEGGPRAGRGDHGSVAERQVERPALCAAPEQEQHADADEDDRELHP